jgi:hypothetical protein
VWSSRERSYWTSRQRVAATTGTRTTTVSPNWTSFSRRPQQQQLQTREQRQQQRFQSREERQQRRHD